MKISYEVYWKFPYSHVRSVEYFKHLNFFIVINVSINFRSKHGLS